MTSRLFDSDQDNSSVLLALLDMGFDQLKIESCLTALVNCSGGVSLEAAVEWLMADAEKQSNSSTLETSRASQPAEIVSRFHLSEEQEKDKKKYETKERQAALKKSREKKLADLKARELIKRQIADDKAAREAKQKAVVNEGGTKVVAKSSDGQSVTSGSCLVQVRLPIGGSMRHNFHPDSTLGDVLAMVTNQCPGQISLVQPFPRKQFTDSEYSHTLKSLGLCPSASLVAVKEKEEAVHQSHEMDAEAGSSEVAATEQSSTCHSDDVVVDGSSSMECSPDRDDDHSKQSDMDTREREEEVDQDDQMQEPPIPLPMPPPLPPRAQIRQHLRRFGEPSDSDDEVEESEERGGHRLGGVAPFSGTPSMPHENVANAVRLAALRRATAVTNPVPTLSSTPAGLQLQVSRLDDLCVKMLVRRSRDYGLPNCTGLSSFVAESLIVALAENKILNTKTLAAFSKCALHKIKLDGYIYMTNELLMALSVHPTLTCLSCRSSPVITDKGIASVMPCFKQLEYLNLNFCKQLTGNICNHIGHCHNLEVLKVSGLDKLTDQNIEVLFANPLDHLTELDISHTSISDRSLEAIAKGAPNLQHLNCEYTKLKMLQHIGDLTQLRHLNISNCSNIQDIMELQNCLSLRSLYISGLKLHHDQFCAVEGLHLSELKLPDRNCFLDASMNIISRFSLQTLDLSDYCHITDEGIRHISAIHSLTVLLLSRTKLTDNGMPFIAGLRNLQELSLDNTAVTDEGVLHIAGLRNLVYLSLSDTKVTSKFLVQGTLKGLHSLNKLNLSRTSIDDEGAFSISNPSLHMLNLEWTLCTGVCTVEELRNRGCMMLGTLRVSNITQKTHDNDS